MLRLIAVILALAVPVTANAKGRAADCAGGPAVQKFLTFVAKDGSAIRVPLPQCNNNGELLKDVTVNVPHPSLDEQRPCAQRSDTSTTLYVRKANSQVWEREDHFKCIKYAD